MSCIDNSEKETTPVMKTGFELNGVQHVIQSVPLPSKGRTCKKCCRSSKSQFFLCDNGDVWVVNQNGQIAMLPYGDNEFEVKYQAKNYIPYVPHFTYPYEGCIGQPLEALDKPFFRDYIGFQVDVDRAVVFYKGNIIYEGRYDGRGIEATYSAYSSGQGYERQGRYANELWYPFIVGENDKIIWEDVNAPENEDGICPCPQCPPPEDGSENENTQAPNWKPKERKYPVSIHVSEVQERYYEAPPGSGTTCRCGYIAGGGIEKLDVKFTQWKFCTTTPTSPDGLCTSASGCNNCGDGKPDAVFPTKEVPIAMQAQCNAFNMNSPGFFCSVIKRCEGMNLYTGSKQLGFCLRKCSDDSDLISIITENNNFPLKKGYRHIGTVKSVDDILGFDASQDNGWLEKGELPDDLEIDDDVREHWDTHLLQPYGAKERGIKDFDVLTVHSEYNYGMPYSNADGVAFFNGVEQTDCYEQGVHGTASLIAGATCTPEMKRVNENVSEWYYWKHGVWTKGKGTYGLLKDMRSMTNTVFLYRDCRKAENPCKPAQDAVAVNSLTCCGKSPLWAVNVGTDSNRVIVGFKCDILLDIPHYNGMFTGIMPDGTTAVMDEEVTCCGNFIFLRLSVANNVQRNIIVSAVKDEETDEWSSNIIFDDTVSYAETWNACCSNSDDTSGTYFALKGKYPTQKGNKHALFYKTAFCKVYDYRDDPCGHSIPCGIVGYGTMYAAFCPESGDTCLYDGYTNLPKADIWLDGELTHSCITICGYSDHYSYMGETGMPSADFPLTKTSYFTTDAQFTGSDYCIEYTYALDVGLSIDLLTNTVYYRYVVRLFRIELWNKTISEENGVRTAVKTNYLGYIGRFNESDACTSTLQVSLPYNLSYNCNSFSAFNPCASASGGNAQRLLQIDEPVFNKLYLSTSLWDEKLGVRYSDDQKPQDVIDDCAKPPAQQNGKCAQWNDSLPIKYGVGIWQSKYVSKPVKCKLVLPYGDDTFYSEIMDINLTANAGDVIDFDTSPYNSCKQNVDLIPTNLVLGIDNNSYDIGADNKHSISVNDRIYDLWSVNDTDSFMDFRYNHYGNSFEGKYSTISKFCSFPNNAAEKIHYVKHRPFGGNVRILGVDRTSKRVDTLYNDRALPYVDYECDTSSVFPSSCSMLIVDNKTALEQWPFKDNLWVEPYCGDAGCRESIKVYGNDVFWTLLDTMFRNKYVFQAHFNEDDNTVRGRIVWKNPIRGNIRKVQDTEHECAYEWTFDYTEAFLCGSSIAFQCSGEKYDIQITGINESSTDIAVHCSWIDEATEELNSGKFILPKVDGHTYDAQCCGLYFSIIDTVGDVSTYTWYYKGVATGITHGSETKATCCKAYLQTISNGTTTGFYHEGNPAPFPAVAAGQTITVKCCNDYAIVSKGSVSFNHDNYRHVAMLGGGLVDRELSYLELIDGTRMRINATAFMHFTDGTIPLEYPTQWITDIDDPQTAGYGWTLGDWEAAIEAGDLHEWYRRHLPVKRDVSDDRDAYFLYKDTLLVRDKRLLDIKCFKYLGSVAAFAVIIEDYETAFWQMCYRWSRNYGPTPSDPGAAMETIIKSLCVHKWIPNPKIPLDYTPPNTMPDNKDELMRWRDMFPNIAAYTAIGGGLVSSNRGVKTDVQEHPSPPETPDMPKGEYLYFNDRNAPLRWDNVNSIKPYWIDQCNSPSFNYDNADTENFIAPITGTDKMDNVRIVSSANGVLTIYDNIFGRIDYDANTFKAFEL